MKRTDKLCRDGRRHNVSLAVIIGKSRIPEEILSLKDFKKWFLNRFVSSHGCGRYSIIKMTKKLRNPKRVALFEVHRKRGSYFWYGDFSRLKRSLTWRRKRLEKEKRV